MREQPGESRYLAGYEDGRSTCLQWSSSEAAHDWIEAHQNVDGAYLAGYEWAVWDYEDANGACHPAGTPLRPGARRTGTA